MRLHTQLITLTSLTFLALLLLFAGLNKVMLKSYEGIETQETHVDLDRARDSIRLKFNELDRVASDWAAWDDTYRFMADRNRAFIESNMPDKAVANLDVNFIMFIKTTGDLHYAKAVNLEKFHEVKLPAGLLERLPLSAKLFSFKKLTDGSHAIIMLDGKPLLLVARQVLTSSFTGPSRGHVVLGRFLDDALVKKLADLVHLSLSIAPVSEMSPDFPKNRILYNSQKTLTGETVMTDMDGERAFIVRIDAPRTIYQQGLKTARTITTSLAVCGLAFLAVLLLFAERYIVKHLDIMGRKAEMITSTPESMERMDESAGSTELQALAHSINRMLDSLAKSSRLLRESEDNERSLREEYQEINVELAMRIAEIKTLQGIIPICAWCKKIRDDEGSWQQMEEYISEHTEADFSHGMCPECSDAFMKEHKIEKDCNNRSVKHSC